MELNCPEKEPKGIVKDLILPNASEYLTLYILNANPGHSVFLLGFSMCKQVNTSNAKATFIQSTRMQRFLKTIKTLSCWYSLDSSRGVLSDEYPCVRVLVTF